MAVVNNWYPPNPADGTQLQTAVASELADQGHVARFTYSAADAVVADADGVLAAVTDNGTQQVITSGLSNPPCPRNVTATAGGTAGDIKAIQVIVAGTNFLDEAITETLPAFTENTAGIVTGSKAFKTVTSVTIPAHDGNGATTAVGFGDKLGLPYKLAEDSVLYATHNGAREGTAPTVAFSSSAIESNTVDLNTALDGSAVVVALVV